jgi:hypothetical protein
VFDFVFDSIDLVLFGYLVLFVVIHSKIDYYLIFSIVDFVELFVLVVVFVIVVAILFVFLIDDFH